MIFASAFLINFQSCTPFRLLPDKQDKLAGLERKKKIALEIVLRKFYRVTNFETL